MQPPEVCTAVFLIDQEIWQKPVALQRLGARRCRMRVDCDMKRGLARSFGRSLETPNCCDAASPVLLKRAVNEGRNANNCSGHAGSVRTS
jgi:hypothetical protein